MVWHTIPAVVQQLFPQRTWQKGNKSIYLTFDDGPVPGVTDYVMNELAKRGQKATFFVVGDNVRKYPELANELVRTGHQLGNHTFNHLNGWKSKKEIYLKNIDKCRNQLKELGIDSSLFRPPYGLITPVQAREVTKSYEIVMWSMLSGDYDLRLNPTKILRNSINYSKPGCIAVFHDQQKTKDVLPRFLPQYLDYVKEMGWETALL